jgi:hypothetical protein
MCGDDEKEDENEEEPGRKRIGLFARSEDRPRTGRLKKNGVCQAEKPTGSFFDIIRMRGDNDKEDRLALARLSLD